MRRKEAHRDVKLTMAMLGQSHVTSSSHDDDSQERPELDLVIATGFRRLRGVGTTALGGQRGRCARCESTG
jgi:hypothetical protein